MTPYEGALELIRLKDAEIDRLTARVEALDAAFVRAMEERDYWAREAQSPRPPSADAAARITENDLARLISKKDEPGPEDFKRARAVLAYFIRQMSE